MYEMLFTGEGNPLLLCCLLVGTSLVGLAVGGAPGVGSLAGPVIALGFTRFDKPQALVTPILILGLVRCLGGQQRSHIRWDVSSWALFPAFFGLCAGIAFWGYLIALPNSLTVQQWVKAVCGVIVISISIDVLLARVLQLYTPPQLGWKASFVMAFFGGMLSTIANVAGPLFTWYFQSKGLQKDQLTATVAFFFFILNLLKLPFYWHLGLFSDPALFQNVADWLLLLGLALIASVTWKLGAWWRHRSTEQTFSFPISLAGLSVGILIIVQSLTS